jgi:hypothetical protein
VVQTDILLVKGSRVFDTWREEESRIADHVHDVAVSFEGLSQEYVIETFRSTHVGNSENQVVYDR